MSEVLDYARHKGLEVRSDDGSNLFVIIRDKEYTSYAQFYNPSLEFFVEETNNLTVDFNPCNPDEPAVLYGDLNYTGSLEEVRKFINENMQDRYKLWVEHLEQTARYDRFMRPNWYVPTYDVTLGLANYLNNKPHTGHSWMAGILSKPRVA